ncbi:hypothetical protein GCM10007167_14730 [Vulcaniibacterium thermophilum]|uniref:Uncharacterized protein n=1 Tax=Vulcaniibacterium thermophilum TaxID=1169913 RepID=A0A918Z4C5_9GAMM|nr:hypothetical protein GCM10007167_14730 [Vulcaniibacterium thermophilum]
MFERTPGYGRASIPTASDTATVQPRSRPRRGEGTCLHGTAARIIRTPPRRGGPGEGVGWAPPYQLLSRTSGRGFTRLATQIASAALSRASGRGWGEGLMPGLLNPTSPARPAGVQAKAVRVRIPRSHFG